MFKDPDMLKRLKEINALPDEDRKCILYNLVAVLRDVKRGRLMLIKKATD